MSYADRLQAAHKLPDALTARLRAIKHCTATWHDYHQAGVLVSELVRSIFAQHGRTGGFYDDLLDMIEDAEWLFREAFAALPDNSELHEYAILCDRELLRAFKRFMTRNFSSAEQYIDLEKAIADLLLLPESPQRTHQLAITHSFLARAQWWHYQVVKSQEICEQAEQNQAYADRLFADNLADAPDRGKAYCSHMLNMALIHQQHKLPWWRKWRRMFVWPTLRLTLRQRDYTQALRALVIGLRGHKGDRWLRARRDTLGVFAETAEQLRLVRRS